MKLDASINVKGVFSSICRALFDSTIQFLFTNLFLIFVRYDTSCNWWQSLPDMPRKLYDCNPIEVGGVLYIVGGKDDDGRTSNIVYCIDDPETNPRLRQKTHLTGSINSIHVSKLDLTLYVSVSLSHRVNYTNLHAYDTSTDVWTMVSAYIRCSRLVAYFSYDSFHVILKF